MAKDKDVNDIHPTKIEIDKLKESAFNIDNVIDFQKKVDDKISEEDRIISELNSKHIFINNLGGKSFITYKVYSEVTDREEIEYIQLDTFKNIYSNRSISSPSFPKGINIAQFWLGHTNRETVDSVIFDPTTDAKIVEHKGKKYLNTWEGFSCKASKGSWKHTKKHIWKILCNSDPVKFKYVIRWLAWLVQNPGKQAEVALVFKGEKGAGKSFLFTQFKKIFGPHGMIISDPNRLAGQHTGHLRRLSFLFCDEVYYPGDKLIEGRIKALITESYIDVRALFQDPTTIKNRLHIIMCTNSDWIIPATKGERRYFIESINNTYAKGNTSDIIRNIYFEKLWKEMDNGGREAMLYDLSNHSLKEWHPRSDIPDTSELRRQKEMSLNALQQAIKMMLEDGAFPGEYRNGMYYTSYEIFNNYLEKTDAYCTKFSAYKKTEAIKLIGAKKGRIPGDGKTRWEFPSLKEMRKNFDKTHGKVAWDDTEKWHVIKGEY